MTRYGRGFLLCLLPGLLQFGACTGHFSATDDEESGQLAEGESAIIDEPHPGDSCCLDGGYNAEEDVPLPGDGDQAPSDSGGNGDQQGSVIWHPAPGIGWQWQLSGTVDTSLEVAMYDIDLFDTPRDTIDRLHADGRVVICYFSAGSREDWRPDADEFPQGVLGNELDGWPGERWLDIRSPEVRRLMLARLDLAATKRCDGVEPDNVDSYQNDPGFPLSAGDQLDYNIFLAEAAHARGLSVGLKNDLDQVPQLVEHFDWALNEECFRYHECDLLDPFIATGKAVFQVEYGDADLADRVCPQANARDFDTLIKHLDLDTWRVACR